MAVTSAPKSNPSPCAEGALAPFPAALLGLTTLRFILPTIPQLLQVGTNGDIQLVASVCCWCRVEKDQAKDNVLVLRRIHIVTKAVGHQQQLGLEAEIGSSLSFGICFPFVCH